MRKLRRPILSTVLDRAVTAAPVVPSSETTASTGFDRSVDRSRLSPRDQRASIGKLKTRRSVMRAK